ncbi:MAG: OadG family protein, partial [Eubacterium sp.]|nr:OadG family protein [Eubacterium sp.]
MYQIALSMTDKIAEAINSYKELIADVDWTEVATVVIAGVGIVLAVLIVLIAVFSGFGKLVIKMEAFSKKMAEKKAARKAKRAAKKAAKNGEVVSEVAEKAPVIKAAPAPVVKAAPQPVVEQGISGEVVAAITAAITASEGSNQFVIRSVKRKDVGSRNPWARAAVND